MEHPELKKVEVGFIDQWFTKLVDNINFNSQQIQAQVSPLANQLTTIDTTPIQFMSKSINKLVDDLNSGFDNMRKEIQGLDNRIKALEGK